MSDERDTQPEEPTQLSNQPAMPRLSGAETTRNGARKNGDAPTMSADAGSQATRVNPVGVRPVPLPLKVGEYKILSLLGIGGMGAVYEAQQARPNRVVALKVIKPGFVSHSLLKRFEREADVLGRLQHPGIAQIYEAGTAPPEGGGPEVPYFAMEMVRGTTLTRFANEKEARPSPTP